MGRCAQFGKLIRKRKQNTEVVGVGVYVKYQFRDGGEKDQCPLRVLNDPI